MRNQKKGRKVVNFFFVKVSAKFSIGESSWLRKELVHSGIGRQAQFRHLFSFAFSIGFVGSGSGRAAACDSSRVDHSARRARCGISRQNQDFGGGCAVFLSLLMSLTCAGEGEKEAEEQVSDDGRLAECAGRARCVRGWPRKRKEKRYPPFAVFLTVPKGRLLFFTVSCCGSWLCFG